MKSKNLFRSLLKFQRTLMFYPFMVFYIWHDHKLLFCVAFFRKLCCHALSHIWHNICEYLLVYKMWSLESDEFFPLSPALHIDHEDDQPRCYVLKKHYWHNILPLPPIPVPLQVQQSYKFLQDGLHEWKQIDNDYRYGWHPGSNNASVLRREIRDVGENGTSAYVMR